MSLLAPRQMQLDKEPKRSQHRSGQTDPEQAFAQPYMAGSELTTNAVLTLQQTRGNTYVRRMLAARGLISTPGPISPAVQREDDDDPQNDPPTPTDQTPPPVPADQDSPPAPVDQNDPSATNQNDPPTSDDQTDPPSASDQTDENDPPMAADQNDPPTTDDVEVTASCLVEEGGDGVGFGGPINVQGKTTANYDHGKPKPPPFPSTAVKTPAGKNAVKVTGTLSTTYTASPTVALPNPPAGLTPCQTQAVQTFINTTLTAHENQHVAAFTGNYNGTVSLPLNFTAPDTESQMTIGLTNAINTEDQQRVKTANAASAKLDPFVATIPGLDCTDE